MNVHRWRVKGTGFVIVDKGLEVGTGIKVARNLYIVSQIGEVEMSGELKATSSRTKISCREHNAA